MSLVEEMRHFAKDSSLRNGIDQLSVNTRPSNSTKHS